MGFKDAWNAQMQRSREASAEKRSAPASQTKTLTLHPKNRGDMKKLDDHLKQGWQIISQTKRGLLEWSPGQIDYVLRKVS